MSESEQKAADPKAVLRRRQTSLPGPSVILCIFIRVL